MNKGIGTLWRYFGHPDDEARHDIAHADMWLADDAPQFLWKPVIDRRKVQRWNTTPRAGGSARRRTVTPPTGAPRGPG